MTFHPAYTKMESQKVKNKNKTVEIEKNTINIETSINQDNNKSVKISLELNSPNKKEFRIFNLF